ncbi:MAG: hypothetical protein DYG88_17030 [Chloroflexi bacterium CFX4]|nr:hypothetical protein [Chloroflexi bacterium CFX4]
MLDINAPIIPAYSAGGFQISSHLPPELINNHFSTETYQYSKSIRYKSEWVDLWVEDGIIW